jgi:hypothetical protein
VIIAEEDPLHILAVALLLTALITTTRDLPVRSKLLLLLVLVVSTLAALHFQGSL